MSPVAGCHLLAGRHLLAGLAVLALMTACGPPRALQRVGWTGTRPVEELLRLDASNLQAIEDLTAEVRFKLHKVGAASGSILYQPPALLRLDVRGPLFQRILAAVIDGDRLLAHDAAGRVYDMPARDGLDAFLEIDMSGYDPRLALLGVVAPAPKVLHIEHPRADRARIVVDDGIDGQRRLLWFDLHTGFARREQLVDDNGTIRWSRDMRDWRRVGDTELYLPAALRIESRGHVLELDFGDVRINRGLERDRFYDGFELPPE